ncbi:hypothetical protein QPK13_16975 [Photorhabdus tasmaniensis]|uniref:hypothetical protein n=1 Tax=Photorhabdus sp. RM323S TaxID=3342828 RepID=UPI0036D942BE
MKSHLVKSDIHKRYYSRARGYVQDILLALLGTGLYCVLTGKINLNAPPNWFINVVGFTLFLWFIFWDLKHHRTKIFIRPSRSNNKDAISNRVDVVIKLIIGIICTSFYDWMLAKPEEALKAVIVFLGFYFIFCLCIFLFGYYTISLSDGNES